MENIPHSGVDLRVAALSVWAACICDRLEFLLVLREMASAFCVPLVCTALHQSGLEHSLL